MHLTDILYYLLWALESFAAFVAKPDPVLTWLSEIYCRALKHGRVLHSFVVIRKWRWTFPILTRVRFFSRPNYHQFSDASLAWKALPLNDGGRSIKKNRCFIALRHLSGRLYLHVLWLPIAGCNLAWLNLKARIGTTEQGIGCLWKLKRQSPLIRQLWSSKYPCLYGRAHVLLHTIR